MKALWILAGVFLLGGCEGPTPRSAQTGPRPSGAVDANRLAQADEEPGEWMTPGRDGRGAYFSPLTQIRDSNVHELGFAWDYALQTTRGLEATPIVVDGIMYTSGNWGRVYAMDAATGQERWTYAPQMDAQWARYACCDAVNRGVAVWRGRVYVASLDGYLHAIDATSGKRIWKVDTTEGRGAADFHYFVSGAPLIAGDLIVIGNGGADFKGARGSVAAFDAAGRLRWRFYTVPKDPAAGPQQQPHLDAALMTWDPHYDWSMGGGGSVWDGMSYDPKLDLIYVGTANPSPYVIGKDAVAGDALYTDCILALHADTGTLAWYYQEVPGDGWDYDATQKIIFAELKFGAKTRSVLLQAAKNGYLYALDRFSGELLSAHPYSFLNWTLGIDPQTHRPIRNPAVDYALQPKLVYPAMTGAHSWQPMSFSPRTGLVYIPVIEAGMVFIETAKRPAGLVEGSFTVAGILPEDYDPPGMEELFGTLPTLRSLQSGIQNPLASRGVLRAVNPITGRVAWEQLGSNIWDGGVLSTAGNLVFRGDAQGFMNVYAADTGRLLHRIEVGTSIMAAPMTYAVRREQYVAVMAGYGGGTLSLPFPVESAARKYGNAGRIVAFKLGGAEVPKPPLRQEISWQPPSTDLDAASARAGEVLYNRYCGRCHVFGIGVLPDLRRMSNATHRIFNEIVLQGAYRGKGMARFDDVLSRSDAQAIHAYLTEQAWNEKPTSQQHP